MVKAQEWLDENYPPEETCIRETADEWLVFGTGWNNINKKRSEIINLNISDEELEAELQMECEEAEEMQKRMDNFYRQNPPREDLALQNILQEISVDYLTTHRENKQLKKENEQLADSLIAVREFEAEVEFILVEEVNK